MSRLCDLRRAVYFDYRKQMTDVDDKITDDNIIVYYIENGKKKKKNTKDATNEWYCIIRLKKMNNTNGILLTAGGGCIVDTREYLSIYIIIRCYPKKKKLCQVQITVITVDLVVLKSC